LTSFTPALLDLLKRARTGTIGWKMKFPGVDKSHPSFFTRTLTAWIHFIIDPFGIMRKMYVFTMVQMYLLIVPIFISFRILKLTWNDCHL
jgi:hypothetical protein